MNNNKFNFLITNFVTLLRVIGIFALIPVFKIYGGLATFMLSASCFLTDCIDGLMARGLKSSTFFGSLFDGLQLFQYFLNLALPIHKVLNTTKA